MQRSSNQAEGSDKVIWRVSARRSPHNIAEQAIHPGKLLLLQQQQRQREGAKPSKQEKARADALQAFSQCCQ